MNTKCTRSMFFAAGLAVISLVTTAAAAQDDAATKPPLDAVLRIEVTPKGVIQLRIDTTGAADQTFDSSEYRYAVLDRDGTQMTSPQLEVGGALSPTGTAFHPVSLPKGSRSVTDYSDVMLDHGGLKSGGVYYVVVSVRNLTASAKFKSP